MAQFATVTELGELLGETLTGTRATQATRALMTVSARIQNWTRQRLERVVDDVVTLAGGGTELELPERPVVAVGAVTLDGDTVTADSWTRHGSVLHRDAGWGRATSTVSVTYTHGYDPIPDDIRAATLLLAARMFTNPQAVATESIGGYSVSYNIGVTDADADMAGLGLGRYRRRVRSVVIGATP